MTIGFAALSHGVTDHVAGVPDLPGIRATRFWVVVTGARTVTRVTAVVKSPHSFPAGERASQEARYITGINVGRSAHIGTAMTGDRDALP